MYRYLRKHSMTHVTHVEASNDAITITKLSLVVARERMMVAA